MDDAHIADELAIDLVAGNLAAGPAAEVRRHLDRCESCRRYVANLARALVTESSSVRPGEGPRLAAGDRIGRYRVDARIGRGGMGEVWSARDLELDRDVAIKLLRHDGDAPELASIAREAEALAGVSHPNVVEVFEVVRTPALAALVMALVDGETLLQWQRRPGRAAAEIIGCYRQIAAGLAAAHAADVIHGDFKPTNVLVGGDARPRVVDFGLAVRARAGADDRDPSLPGGTVGYMAPELARGGAPSTAADQFAFCVALWEALAGVRPFAGDGVDSLSQAIERGSPRRGPVAIPRRVAQVVARGLAADPGERWPSMTALDDAIAAAMRHRPWAALALAATVPVVVIAALPRAAVDDPCRAARDALARAWDPEIAARGEATLIDTAGPEHRGAAASLVEGFTAAIAGWDAEYEGACAAGARVRIACLDVQADELVRQVEGLTAVDLAVRPASEWIAAIPRARECRSADARPGSFADELRNEVIATHREILLDPGAGARARAEALVEQAQAADEVSGSTLAMAWIALAAAQTFDDDHRAGLGSFEAAYLAAWADDDVGSAGEAAKGATVCAIVLGRYEEAARWLRHFESAIELESWSVDAPAEAAALSGDLAHSLGDVARADAEFARALALAPPEATIRVRVLGMQGQRAIERGEYAVAEQAYLELLRFAAEHDGPIWQDSLTALEGLGLAQGLLFRFDEAKATYARVHDIIARRWGTNSHKYLFAMANYAQLLSLLGDGEGAFALLLTLVEPYAQMFGGDHPALGQLHFAIAFTANDLHRWADALEHLDRGMVSQVDHAVVIPAPAWIARARAQTELGRYQAAEDSLDRAAAVATAAHDAGAIEVGRARNDAAQSSWAAATAHLDRARTLLPEPRGPLALRHADLERLAAEVAIRSGAPERARTSIARARELLAGNADRRVPGMRADLDRLTAAL